MPRYEEIEEACLADYKKHEGLVVLASRVHGVFSHCPEEIGCTKPIRVRIDTGQKQNSFINWTTERWCDTSWDVTLLEQNGILSKASSLWIDGISRSLDGEINHGPWVIDEDQTIPDEQEEDQESDLNQIIKVDPPLKKDETLSTFRCPVCRSMIIQRLAPHPEHDASR